MTDVVHVVGAHCQATNRVPRERLGAEAKCGKCKQALLVGRPFELTAAGFDRHIGANDLPPVVDFWAPWCVRLAKLDTEAEPELAARFAIRAIPTLIAFRNGHEVARRSGASDLPGLLQWIKSNV